MYIKMGQKEVLERNGYLIEFYIQLAFRTTYYTNEYI